MERLKTIYDLLELNHGDKFYVIQNGNGQPYIFCSKHPKSPDLAVVINDGNYKKSTVFYKTDFDRNAVFITGSYDSNEIGNIKIAQLQDQIQAVETIYLKPQKNE